MNFSILLMFVIGLGFIYIILVIPPYAPIIEDIRIVLVLAPLMIVLNAIKLLIEDE